MLIFILHLSQRTTHLDLLKISHHFWIWERLDELGSKCQRMWRSFLYYGAFFFFFFPVLGWELLHGTLPRLKGRLWPAWSDHLSRSTHSHNNDVALTPTGFSKIWQSLQFLLLSSQMESGLAWNHLLFYCTVQNSNNFDGQITLFESGRVCRMWHLYDRHTHTHRQPYFQQV